MATGPGPRQSFHSRMVAAKFGATYYLMNLSCRSDYVKTGGVVSGHVASTAHIHAVTVDGALDLDITADVTGGYQGNEIAVDMNQFIDGYTITKDDIKPPKILVFQSIRTVGDIGGLPPGILAGGDVTVFVPISLVRSPLTCSLDAIGMKYQPPGPVAPSIADGSCGMAIGKPNNTLKEGFVLFIGQTGNLVIDEPKKAWEDPEHTTETTVEGGILTDALNGDNSDSMLIHYDPVKQTFNKT